MRIGFDAKRAFANKSGLGNYSRDIIMSLADFYPENEYFLFSPYTETNLLDKRYFKSKTISPKAKTKIGKSYWRSVSMGKEIDNMNLDVFHGLSNELPLNIKKANTKKVVTIHDLIFLKYPHLYNFIDKHIYKEKFEKACINADKIIAVSTQTKEDIIRYFGIPDKKIDVIYQSCNKIFSSKHHDDYKDKVRKKYSLPERFVLTVGTIERRKNVLNVIKALFYYDIDINYVVVGRKTSYFKEIEAFLRKHDLHSRLHVLDNVENNDLPAIYQMSEIFVYPSLYEGFGIPILEAFNSEVPVITSDVGATAEIGGNASLLIDPLNSKSIGEAIKSLLSDNGLKLQLVRDGLERSKLFDREVICNNIMKFYKTL